MNALAKLTLMETKLFLRDPGAVAFGVLFPSALLLGLGAVPMLREPSADLGGYRFVDLWAPTALVFSIVLIGAQHVPILIATYRERGVLRRLSTTPIHPGYVLLAQLIVAFVFVSLSALLLVFSAWAAFGVSPPEHPWTFALAFVVGYAAVLGISMISAAIVPTSTAATSVGTVMFMVLMFLGGAFLPRTLLPEIIVQIGEFVPPGVQSLLAAWFPAGAEITSGGQPQWLQLAIMAGIAVVSSAVAAKLFRWG